MSRLIFYSLIILFFSCKSQEDSELKDSKTKTYDELINEGYKEGRPIDYNGIDYLPSRFASNVRLYKRRDGKPISNKAIYYANFNQSDIKSEKKECDWCNLKSKENESFICFDEILFQNRTSFFVLSIDTFQLVKNDYFYIIKLDSLWKKKNNFVLENNVSSRDISSVNDYSKSVFHFNDLIKNCEINFTGKNNGPKPPLPDLFGPTPGDISTFYAYPVPKLIFCTLRCYQDFNKSKMEIKKPINTKQITVSIQNIYK
jgi:hypothetical protein